MEDIPSYYNNPLSDEERARVDKLVTERELIECIDGLSLDAYLGEDDKLKEGFCNCGCNQGKLRDFVAVVLRRYIVTLK